MVHSLKSPDRTPNFRTWVNAKERPVCFYPAGEITQELQDNESISARLYFHPHHQHQQEIMVLVLVRHIAMHWEHNCFKEQISPLGGEDLSLF